MNIRRILIILVLTSSLLLSGCDTSDPVKNADRSEDAVRYENDLPYFYTEANVAFHEPEGAVYSAAGWQIVLDGITLQFTDDISADDRDLAVTEISRLLRLSEEQLGTMETDCSIRVRSGSYAPWSYDHVLYIGYQELGTQKLTVGLGQMLFGHEAGYGLCYGFGVELAREAGYPLEGELTTAETALTLCDDSPLYLDLNYACFLPDYADEETLAKVRTVAVELYRFMEP